jgi:N-acetylglucosaminyl-diphospho-decaprenol L-rhamnosyltransferase
MKSSMAVCIISYNTCESLRSCLQSVIFNNASEIWVVDNHSSDGSQEMVRAEFPTVELVEVENNIGYGAAADLAISLSDTPYILLLNSDTILKSNALDKLSEYLDKNPRVGIVGPRITNVDGTLQPSCFPMPTPLHIFFDVSQLNQLINHIPSIREQNYRTWSHNHNRAVPWVQGSALAVRRKAYDAAGGFDKAFFMYYEEVDLCYRMSNAGWGIHFSPVTEVTHIGAISTNQSWAKMELQYYKSLALFYRKHYSGLQFYEMVLLIKCVAMARLIRDSIFRLLSHPENRPNLTTRTITWKHILIDGWYR